MAKQRGPDGMPIDVPTSQPPLQPAAEAQRGPPRVASASSGDEDTLLPLRERAVFPRKSSHSVASEPPTRIYGGSRGATTTGVTNVDGMADPVVGWLAIVAGPGRGHFVRVGNGLNSVGRNPKSRIQLNFGDDEISHDNSATVTYDPKGRKFYAQQGTGSNLVYVNEKPVLIPTELQSGDNLRVGNTCLRFIALCGPAFSWLDE